MKQQLIIIRGPPGIGKTTIAKELAKKLPNNVAVIDSDILRWDFIPKKTKTFNDHKVVYKSLFDLTKNYLDNGLNVIVEGILSARTSSETLRIDKYAGFRKKGVKVTYIFLKGTDNIQDKRVKSRKKDWIYQPTKKDIKGWTKLSYSSISKNDNIINSNKSKKAILKDILTLIK